MLINLFGNWINPQNIIAVTSATDSFGEKASKIIFSNNAESNYSLEFKDKSPADIATEINNAISAARKSSFPDRGERRGGGDRGGRRDGGFKRKFEDRGGYKGGGDKGGYKGNRDRSDRDEGKNFGRNEEFKEKVRDDFKKKKFEGGRKFDSKNRGDFRPKKRREEY